MAVTLQDTPSSNRVHIGLFGRRNAGNEGADRPAQKDHRKAGHRQRPPHAERHEAQDAQP